MRFQLVSDLHIDIGTGLDFELPGGEILLVAGDLCEISSINTRLIQEPERKEKYENRARKVREKIWVQFSKYKRVFAVLGNHDHANGDFNLTADMFRESFPGVTLLDNSWEHLSNNLVIFGSTLWTNLDKGNPLIETSALVWYDYNQIEVGDRLLRTSDTLAAHKESLTALHKCIDENPDKEILVLTHFVPSPLSCAPRYKMSLDNAFFYSDLSELMLDNPNIKTWCHGHTHDFYEYYIGECRVICNPRGYQFCGSRNPEETGYNVNFELEINGS